jgi:prepilin-type N-terminal cleavage/methylation domain-containing protein
MADRQYAVHTASMKRMRGFSLLEMMIVAAIIMMALGVSIIQIAPMMREAKANAALQTTLGEMRRAHEMAVDRRQVYRLTFTAPRNIQVDRVTIDPVTNARAFVFQSRIDLPVETQFRIETGLPATPTTVPDGFGNGGIAIDFSRDFGGGGKEIFFQRDGRALDSANRLNSGVVYMCRPGELYSCKAVSLIGATGRSKGWRLNQTPSGARWIQ